MQTLPQFIEEALREPRPQAFGERLGAPEWRYLSSHGMLERAKAIAVALRYSGVQRGDRVALISNNRIDWLAANFGILIAGCVVVPIFATLAPDQTDYIFLDSDAKLAFAEKPEDVERLRASCPHMPRAIHFDGAGPDSLATFESAGKAHLTKGPAIVGTFTDGMTPDTDGITPDDLAVLIYTSGTTGNP
ncbi:MAG TPA: AMP-binding protein, partial [Candidatus Baltobacteraceae bacterium]|nr:AMP-binding protein [Candidatus Baltobacteraceae bacterium]